MPDQLTVTITLEDGAMWATAEEYPGLFASGSNAAELIEALEEALSFYLAPEDGPAPRIKIDGIAGAKVDAHAELVPA